LIFTASLLVVQHKRNSVEIKLASLLLYPWARHLMGLLISLSG